jgi:hypothetical protein
MESPMTKKPKREKSVSLHPLTLAEAVRGLGNVKLAKRAKKKLSTRKK